MMPSRAIDQSTEPRRRSFFRNAALAIGGLVGAGSVRGLQAREPAGLEPFIGEIIAIPYNFAPRGFVYCEGQTMAISDNQALFSLIGVLYGGDGRRTFMLPDTRAVEAAAKKAARASRPPFRYAIATTGIYPSRA